MAHSCTLFVTSILIHSVHSFYCNDGKYINDTFKCNGWSNCVNGTDETEDLCKYNCCSPNEFRCDYGACIPNYLQCNGLEDCIDESDEINCKNQFQCDNGTTSIPQSWLCDGIVDFKINNPFALDSMDRNE